MVLRSGGLTSDEVAQAWSAWLGQEPFSLLLTVTSAKVTHPESMLKRVRYIVTSMNRRYFGKSWKRRPWKAIQSAVAIERHKSGNPHAHALLRFPDELPPDFPRQEWQEFATETGGFCKLEIPRCQGDVVDYCCKYVVKGGQIVLSDNFRPVRVQPGLFDARKSAAQGARFRVEVKAAAEEHLRELLADE